MLASALDAKKQAPRAGIPTRSRRAKLLAGVPPTFPEAARSRGRRARARVPKSRVPKSLGELDQGLRTTCPRRPSSPPQACPLLVLSVLQLGSRWQSPTQGPVGKVRALPTGEGASPPPPLLGDSPGVRPGSLWGVWFLPVPAAVAEMTAARSGG